MYDIFIIQLCRNYVNLKQKFNRRINFLKTLVSQELFASICRFKKKIGLKFPEFSIWKILFAFNLINFTTFLRTRIIKIS